MKVPDTSHSFIFWLFNRRCLGIGDNPCYKFGNHLSHIDPRSSGQEAKTNWRNLCVHCDECHTKYHNLGTSEEAISEMLQKRAERLEDIGREQYI